ncbi:hypothetical protein M0R45_006589 [Rubus argutus]|uniref:Uncharacterized protein n=1 Tax=Rubus argutus TaxID=59490 RepID=A0AAW1YR71_RUBAR
MANATAVREFEAAGHDVVGVMKIQEQRRRLEDATLVDEAGDVRVVHGGEESRSCRSRRTNQREGKAATVVRKIRLCSSLREIDAGGSVMSTVTEEVAGPCWE